MKFGFFGNKSASSSSGFPADPLQRFREGDACAFDEIVESFAPGIVRLFRRQGADTSTADDLAQEVFIRLLKTDAGYESRGKLQLYLYRIARNVWLDWKRSNGSRPAARSLDFPVAEVGVPPLALLAHPACGPVDAVVGRDAARALSSLMMRLSERERTVLELTIFEGMRYADAARVLSIPEGTVKSRVFNAMRKLRAWASTGVNSVESGSGGEAASE
ncbi:MAG: RNA polymerase sigma factor [Planctomycetes bacterium]|nr:RNA polymerase sigma factor [Planctomycetota bacterium]